MKLFHGSRGGIVGNIKPISRERCDFEKGFYLGEKEIQTQTLVSNDSQPVFYTCNLDIDKIPNKKILILEPNLEWTYFVLYNRGRLPFIKNDYFQNIINLSNNKDLIIGPIADDNMTRVIKNFSNNLITDKVLLESLKGLDYGRQYVCKTEVACNCISILTEREPTYKELQEIKEISECNRKKGFEIAEQKFREFRREGKYLDEIIETLNKGEVYR